MPWPSLSDYTQAVGNFPHISILDPKLKGGNPRRGSNNDLISYSGGFSIVFPIEVLTNAYALRCWIRDIGDAETRYQKISDYLRQCHLPYFVDFAYISEGILVNGKKYSITRMEWAEGETLCDFIKQNLRDARCLKSAAAEFQKMVETLHAHQISHGDLQDGNILLERNGTDVNIKLIDYDSLFVPALRGQPDSIIVGLPEYQHPQRIVGGGGANEKVDYFSELVIYLSLLSLAEKPDLWSQFGDRTERGLLFTAEDFKNPDQSDVFRELENLSPAVKQLASKLKEFCKLSIGQLEPLEAVLPKTSPAQVAYNQGLTYLRNNQYNEAVVEFDKAIGLDPNYKEAYHGLGLAHFQMSNFGEARRAAEAALRIDRYYQPAIQLLDTIKLSVTPPVTPAPSPTGQSGSTGTKPASHSPPPAGTSGQTSTNPTSQSSPPTGAPGSGPINPASQGSSSTGQSGPTATNPTSQALKSQRASLNRWRYLTGALASVLAIWIVVFVMQMSEKDKVPPQDLLIQLAELRSERILLRDENQKLKKEMVSLKNSNQKLRGDNQELQHKNTRNLVQNRERQSQPTGGTRLNSQRGAKSSENQISVTRKRASETGLSGQNRNLQNYLSKGSTEQDEEVQTQIARAQDETVALRSQNERLQDENEKLRSETRMLHNDNRMLHDDNQRLHNENAALQKRLEDVESVTIPNYDHLHPAPLQEISHESRPRVRSAAMSKNNQGYIAFNRSEYDKAIALFQDGIMNDSNATVVYYNLGCTYLEIKEYTNAVNYFREAVTLDPNFKEARYNLALAYLRWDYPREAVKAAHAALDVDENYPLARQLLEAVE